MLSKFQEGLNKLNGDLTMMGSMCEKAIASAVKALLTGDKKLAGEVKAVAEEIDKKEREIENECLRMLLSHQPVAKDLRVISSALKLVSDMERIGDNSQDIAEIVCSADIPSGEIPEIREMAEGVIKMVRESLEAFCNTDEKLALSVIEYDDVVDSCFLSVKNRLTKRLLDASFGESALDVLMIAKYLERIGDHAVNIGKWVVFSITAEKPE